MYINRFENTPESEQPVNDDDSIKFGLKVLSVKVRELVEEEGETTYKDVANELIRQIREKKKAEGNLENIITGLDYIDEGAEEDEDEMTDESPDKKV